MSQEVNKSNIVSNEGEIDLTDLIVKIWNNKKTILKVVIVFFVLGILLAYGSKKEYSSGCSFVMNGKQDKGAAGGLLAQYGGIAGINLNSLETVGNISPEIYENIITNRLFLLTIANEPVRFKSLDTTLTVYSWYHNYRKLSLIEVFKKYTIKLPRTIFSKPPKFEESNRKESIGNNEIIKISSYEERITNYLEEQIEIEVDLETGTIYLDFHFPDPFASAELTKLIFVNLTDYLIEYEVEKSTADLNFIQEQYKIAKKNYLESQEKLAQFRDKNLNVMTSSFSIEEERLLNEYEIAFGVFNGLAQQLEQKKIKVQEDMPVLRIINSIEVPNDFSSPKRKLILAASIFFGVLFGIAIVLSQDIINKIKGAFKQA